MNNKESYKDLYTHLNFNLGYDITHKNLKNSLKILERQLKDSNVSDDYNNIYEYLDNFDGEDLINIFMEQHI